MDLKVLFAKGVVLLPIAIIVGVIVSKIIYPIFNKLINVFKEIEDIKRKHELEVLRITKETEVLTKQNQDMQESLENIVNKLENITITMNNLMLEFQKITSNVSTDVAVLTNRMMTVEREIKEIKEING